MSHPHSRPMCRRAAAAALAAALLSPLPSLAIDVDCGTIIPSGEVGVLQADLVCGDGNLALGRGATLQLNGHSIVAATPQLGQVGVACFRGLCTIEGPGTIAGFLGAGIVGLDPSKIVARGITVEGNGIGILADRARLFDVTLTANEDWGASGRKLEATNVTSTGNVQDGLGGYGLKLVDVTVSGNGAHGVRCNRVNAKRLTATDNVGYGVRSIYQGNTKLVDSTVTGNGVADVGSQGRPKLVGTTCGTSRRLSETGSDLGTWGFCGGD